MNDIHIAGTGIWFPDEVITNDEIVSSFNSYVDNFNEENKNSCLLYTSPSPRDPM